MHDAVTHPPMVTIEYTHKLGTMTDWYTETVPVQQQTHTVESLLDQGYIVKITHHE